MVAADLGAPLREPQRLDNIADGERAAPHDAVMHDRVVRALRIGHVETGIAGSDLAAVADLTALLGVERRAVEDQLGVGALLDPLDRRAVNQDCEDRTARREPGIARELAA